ncbi:hypothetical protein H257_13390 [Aphanomyces astaci]|uniref:Major facilitator superfamily (MFS) profile domain-containing protein n=1 Tax=Aphanomyces astaci TaxID=112090 RepID=W4FUS5_APHAT|nr:hypothetical protein H257_13390 [Aphanomyces astaci]ETV71250.1 hypothetical protein H257_13390 [Aphanomyces astaci]|eukprot:XP_009839190.1 hypothetical protein H257_13390 [Aphanomyces astaci]
MPPTEVLDAAADSVVDDSAVTDDTSPTLSMDSADESNVLTIHEAIQRVGYGTFQKRLLLVSGLMFMADAVEVMLLSFLQVLVKDEWHLTSTQQAGITAAVFAGELPGALFWGFFADKYGRRLGFLLSALCIAVFGIWSAFVPTVWWLMACRAMVGFGVSGALVPFDLMAEFLPDSERARVLLLFQLYWTVGIAFVAILAWVVIESWGWRWLTGLCATPLVLVLCSFPWMPESPKWLVDQHRYDEAIHVLEATAKLNGTTLPYNVRIRPLESKGVKEQGRVIGEICSRKLWRASTMLFLTWLGFGLSYYGIILLFPRIFKPEDGQTFNYTCIFLAAVAEVLGVFLTMTIVDTVGRRQTQIALYFVCALAVFLSALDLDLVSLTILAMAARAFIMGASSTTWLATPEAFPTHVRTSGHGIASAMCRLGGFVTPFIADSESMSVAGVCGIYGTCLLLTTVACYLLPPDSINPDLLVVCDTACELVALTTEEDSSVGKAADMD